MHDSKQVADRVLYEEFFYSPEIIEEDLDRSILVVMDKTTFSSKSDNHTTRDFQFTARDGVCKQETQKDTFSRNEEDNTLLNNKGGKPQDVEMTVDIEDTRIQTLLYNVTDHPPISVTLISGFQVRISLFHCN